MDRVITEASPSEPWTRAVAQHWHSPAGRRKPAGAREQLPVAQSEGDELEGRHRCPLALADACGSAAALQPQSVAPTSRAVSIRVLLPARLRAGAQRCGCCSLPTGGSEPSPFAGEKPNLPLSLWVFVCGHRPDGPCLRCSSLAFGEPCSREPCFSSLRVL